MTFNRGIIAFTANARVNHNAVKITGRYFRMKKAYRRAARIIDGPTGMRR